MKGKLAILLTILMLFSICAVVFAANDLTTTKGGNLVGAQEKVQIDAAVQKDAILAGQSIKISAPITRTLMAAAETVTVESRVNGNVRVVGSTISLQNDIGGDVWVAGSQVESKGIIYGDVLVFAQSLDVADVHGKLTFAGDVLRINGEIKGDVDATSREIVFGENGSIKGNLKLVSSTPISDKDRVKVMGSISQEKPKTRGIEVVLLENAVRFIGSVIVLCFLLLIFAKPFDDMAWHITEKPFKTPLVGLLSIIVIPIVCVLLLVTIVGIPLAIVLGGTFILLVATAHFIFALWLGKKLLPRQNRFAAGIFGLFLISLAFMIPILGLVARFVTICFGLGGFLSLWHKTAPVEHHKPLGRKRK